jgi:hypothetical protein
MHQHVQANIGKDCRENASKQDSAPTEQTTGMGHSYLNLLNCLHVAKTWGEEKQPHGPFNRYER